MSSSLVSELIRHTCWQWQKIFWRPWFLVIDTVVLRCWWWAKYYTRWVSKQVVTRSTRSYPDTCFPQLSCLFPQTPSSYNWHITFPPSSCNRECRRIIYTTSAYTPYIFLPNLTYSMSSSWNLKAWFTATIRLLSLPPVLTLGSLNLWFARACTFLHSLEVAIPPQVYSLLCSLSSYTQHIFRRIPNTNVMWGLE